MMGAVSSFALRVGPILRWPGSWIAALLLLLLIWMPMSGPFFHELFPKNLHPVYTRASFFELTSAHCMLVGISSLLAASLGIGVGIFVTRENGRDFLGMANSLAAIGQTFPPVAVLALSVPLLGYGAAPTLVALTLYGILPILENTITGLDSVPVAARDAAIGMGFSPWRLLTRIELPLALPFIVAGLRTSVVINISTATVGASIGALSLGSPIIEGLSAANIAYVIQGALVVAVLAILADNLFGLLARLVKST
jgi:osmoprotectant transport system permease protein